MHSVYASFQTTQTLWLWLMKLVDYLSWTPVNLDLWPLLVVRVNADINLKLICFIYMKTQVKEYYVLVILKRMNCG